MYICDDFPWCCNQNSPSDHSLSQCCTSLRWSVICLWTPWPHPEPPCLIQEGLLDWKHPQPFTGKSWQRWVAIVVWFLESCCVLDSTFVTVFENMIPCIHIHFHTEANPFSVMLLTWVFPKHYYSLFFSEWVMTTLRYHCWCLSNHDEMAVTKLTALWILPRLLSLSKSEPFYSRKLL